MHLGQYAVTPNPAPRRCDAPRRARRQLGRLDHSVGNAGGHALTGMTHFEMLALESLQYSGPGAGLSLWGTRNLGNDWMLDGEVLAAGLPLVAMTSELASERVGRAYDLVAGGEARFWTRLRRGVLSLEVQVGTARFWPIDAAATGQVLHRRTAEVRLPIAGGLAAVLRARAFERRATFPDPMVTRNRTTQFDLILASVVRSRPRLHMPDAP